MNALDPFGDDIVRRCRWVIEHNSGHPSGAWSTGEQLAVALALRNREHLAGMDSTPTEAAQRVSGGMVDPPPDFQAWLDDIRNRT